MCSILLLINKYFWKGMVGPVFAYIVPVILILFIGRIIGAALIVPGAFMIPILSILLVFLPQSIFEFRNSSLLKRIGTTPIRPYKFLLGISIFNILVVISAFLLMFIFSFAIFYDDLGSKNTTSMVGNIQLAQPTFLTMIRSADWWSYIYCNFVVVLLTTIIGLFIAFIARSTLFIQCVGISIMLISLFIGPCILPVSLVGSINIVKWLGYIFPLKYPIACAIESFTSGIDHSIVNLDSSSIWNPSSSYMVFNIMYLKDFSHNPDLIISLFSKEDKYLNLIMPWVFILIFLYFCAATFRWSNRGKVKYNWSIIKVIYHWFKENQFLKTRKAENDLSSPYVIEVLNLTKKFKMKNQDLYANKNISFNLKRGRNLAILGHNGAGKSVLLEIIVGISAPQEGKIKYNFSFNKTYKEKIGIQFQDSSYPYGLSAWDIISFFSKVYKLTNKQEINDLIKQFGVQDFCNKNISTLSGGQQQRINLLLAILNNPNILILDELSTGLDIKIRYEIKAFIKEYANKHNINIIIVSHDMDEVEYLADDILLLKNGEVKYYGSKKDILKRNESLEKFLYKHL